MKKTIIFTSAITILLAFSSCNNTTQSEQKSDSESNATSTSETQGIQDEKHSCLIPIPAGDSAKYISKEVTVTGDIEHPLTLNVDSLKKMNAVTIENFTVVCQSGTTMKEDKNSPELRFPEFKGEWENNNLGKIAKYMTKN